MHSALLWFKHDLRLDDHPALRAGLAADRLLPVFILDPEWVKRGPLGTRRLGVHRARFLLESLTALDVELRSLGSRLLVCAGHPEQVLAQLTQRLQIDEVLTLDELDPRQRQQLGKVARALGNCRLRLFPDDSLLNAMQRPAQIPASLEAFIDEVDQLQPVFQPLPTPDRIAAPPEAAQALFGPVPNLSQLGFGEPQAVAHNAFPFAGGELAARSRLRDYLWVSLGIRRHLEAHEDLFGNDACAKLSPWLSLGSLSPRRVVAELRRHESQFGATPATRSLWHELLQREYLRLVPAWKAPQEAVSSADERFSAWTQGRTGLPIVDAAMRELAATGFITLPARQIAGHYLVHALEQDWRLGATWFEEHQIDQDPTSNWGNWARLAASTPLDVQQLARQLDPEAAYVALWVPELRGLVASVRHTPYLLPEEQFRLLNYPRPQTAGSAGDPPPAQPPLTRQAS